MNSCSDDKWVVLRCNSKLTLKLVEGLKAFAIDAWSPIKIVHRRVPRKNVREKIEVSTLSTFAFIPDHDRDSACLLSGRKGVPLFSLMKVFGYVVTVNKRELDFMQRVSWDNVKTKPHPIGCSVRFRSGSFEGIEGKVVSSSDKECSVEIKDTNVVVKIPPFLLVRMRA